MTVAAHGPRLEPRTLEEAVTALRERGIRVTAARRLVLQGLFAADGPVSAERLASGVDGAVPPSDLASVYRNLEALERVGLVRHVHLGHGPGLYARSGPGGARVPGVRALRRHPGGRRRAARRRPGYDPRGVRLRGSLLPLPDRRAVARCAR